MECSAQGWEMPQIRVRWEEGWRCAREFHAHPLLFMCQVSSGPAQASGVKRVRQNKVTPAVFVVHDTSPRIITKVFLPTPS